MLSAISHNRGVIAHYKVFAKNLGMVDSFFFDDQAPLSQLSLLAAYHDGYDIFLAIFGVFQPLGIIRVSDLQQDESLLNYILLALILQT